MVSINFTKLAKELKLHLRRSAKSREIVEHDLLHYFRKTIRNLLYVNWHHTVINTRLLKKQNVIYLRYNFVKIKSHNNLKIKRKKKRDKEYALSWSKRIVAYLKRQRGSIYSTEYDLDPPQLQSRPTELRLEPEIIEKLNERIKLYKNSATKSNELESSSSGVVDSAAGSITLKAMTIQSEESIIKNCEESTSSSTFSPDKTTNGDKLHNLTGHKFLDNLINKLKCDHIDRASMEEAPKAKIGSSIQITSKPTSLIEKVNLREDSESSNSSDFCGFNDTETIAGLLPTPVVPSRKQSDKSAFVSEHLDAFLRENSLENSANIELPKSRQIEDGMVYEGAQPPKMTMQPVAEELAKARTVAEKRQLLQRKRNLKYFVIENENTIYRELKRRCNYGRWNNALVSNLQKGDLPFTRDCWKATSWLRTLNGKFCFQIITVDGKNYKLIGARGNHSKKILGNYESPKNIKRPKIGCPPGCRQQLNIKEIKPKDSKKCISEGDQTDDEKRPKILKLLSSLNENVLKYKPGPLSKKCQMRQKDDPEGGRIEIYKMPSVQLEVFPKINQPLDEKIKPYLKLVLPSEKISREWAEFAVSTLMINSLEESEKSVEIRRESFTFNIPYLNQQKNVLVRKVVNRNEKFDHNVGRKLKFLEAVNKNDSMELICGNVLAEMIDCVALNLSEDSLIKNDPWIDYSHNKIKDIYTTHKIEKKDQCEIGAISKDETNAQNIRLLKELKRLNATIVKADSHSISDPVKCDEGFCQLGCICHSLSGPKVMRKHCGKVECMFQCNCSDNTSTNGKDLDSLSKEDAMLLREQATARLAKVEKEFCSTLVLTGTTSYLLNDSKSEKRRQTKVPKRYSDFIHKEGSTNSREPDVEIPNSKSQPQVYYKGSVADFKHCNVDLLNLECLEDIEPWCMTHCVYKCFCKGKNVDGVAFCFDNNSIVEEIVEEPPISRKRRYSFDQTSYQLSPTATIKRKYYSRGYVSGTRTSAIPSDIYIKINRQKAKSVNAKIKSEETEAKEALLKKRISDSRGVSPNTIQAITNAIQGKQSTSEKQKIEKEKLSQPPKQSHLITPPSTSPPNVSVITKVGKRVSPKTRPQEKTDMGHSADMEYLTQKQTTDSFPVITSAMSLTQNKNGIMSNGKISTDRFHRRTIAVLNIAVTKTMQSISKIQSQDLKRIPNPLPGTLCSTQWKHFLTAFVENRIFVWEVVVKNHNILVATKLNVMPQIPSAICAANIRILPLQNLPLIAQLLLKKIYNKAMNTMSVLMAGQSKYWRIIGCTKSDLDYTSRQCIVKPTPQSHPKVSTKVNELYQLLFLQQMNSLTQVPSQNKSQPSTSKPLPPIRKPQPSTSKLEPLTSKTEPSTSKSQVRLPNNSINQPLAVKTSSSQQFSSESTNLEFKKITKKAAESIVIPIPNKRDHFWLMISLEGDFSHIYIHDWNDFLTYERIRKSFDMAIDAKKTVRLGCFRADTAIYATPHSTKRLFIGPFFGERKIGLVLCQTLDGKIISREDYEKSQNIKHIRRTVGYWLKIRNSVLISHSPDVEEAATSGLPQGELLRRALKSSPSPLQRPEANIAKSSAGKQNKTTPVAFPGFREIVGKKGGHGSMFAARINNRSLLKQSTFSSNNMQVNIHEGQMTAVRPEKHIRVNSIEVADWNDESKSVKKMYDLILKQSSQENPNSFKHDPSLATESSTTAQMVKNSRSPVPNTIPSRQSLPPTNTTTKLAVPGDLKRLSQKMPGYFVSNDISLGKVMAAKTADSTYFIRMRLAWEWLSFANEKQVNLFLKNIIIKFTRGRYNNPLLKWYFLPADHPFGKKFASFSLENLRVGGKNEKNHPTTPSEQSKASCMKTYSKADLKRPRNPSPVTNKNESDKYPKYPALSQKPSSSEVILIDDD